RVQRWPNAVSNAIEYAKFRSRSPAHRKSRAKQRADKVVVVHVPDPRLPSINPKPPEQKVWVSVAVEIGHPKQLPVRRKSRARQRDDKIVVVHVPHTRCACAKIEERKACVVSAVNIDPQHHKPAREHRKSRAKLAEEKIVVVHVPDRRLVTKRPPLEHKVWA